MSKVLKNTTISDIEIKTFGQTVPASGQITVDSTDYLLLSSEDVIAEITSDINAGNLVVNDGLRDLTAFDGLNYLSYADDAFNIRFLNDPDRVNGFSSRNVQDAIEELRGSAIGALVPFVFVSTGNTADKWLGAYVPSTSSNDVPLIIMQEISVKGILFSNQDDNVDCDIKIYKNGSLVHLEQVRNKRTYYNVGISGIPLFDQGDRMSVFFEKVTSGSGDSTAQNPVVTVVCKVTNEVAGTGGTQFGVV